MQHARDVVELMRTLIMSFGFALYQLKHGSI
ncbi:hypothetical protein Gorai_006172 [Gossypium raimondii]|uniref:Uncharacterized protein n=1 Tax=Gossypium raimondii TaxID=29730 RepID=A0A7J8QFB3_GOSRA|nr:hypothetical protein [Gossypium raimondii]